MPVSSFDEEYATTIFSALGSIKDLILISKKSNLLTLVNTYKDLARRRLDLDISIELEKTDQNLSAYYNPDNNTIEIYYPKELDLSKSMLGNYRNAKDFSIMLIHETVHALQYKYFRDCMETIPATRTVGLDVSTYIMDGAEIPAWALAIAIYYYLRDQSFENTIVDTDILADYMVKDHFNSMQVDNLIFQVDVYSQSIWDKFSNENNSFIRSYLVALTQGKSKLLANQYMRDRIISGISINDLSQLIENYERIGNNSYRSQGLVINYIRDIKSL